MPVQILHIETSSKNCSVSIGTDGIMTSLCEEFSQDFKHSENLHTFINLALEKANIGLEDINAISIGKGPGSYTGLRIGLSSAKGLCFGKDIPLISVDTLYILASPYFDLEYDFIIPIIDARRMEIYMSVFSKEGKYIEEAHAHILNQDSFQKYKSQNILFVGDASDKVENFIKENNYNQQNFIFKNSYPSAKEMISVSYQKYIDKDFEDIAYFDPSYLKEWK